ARIYGESAGYGMSSDAHHITSPDSDGPRRGMLNALRNGGVAPDEIDYVNAHGTSTPLGDRNETVALKLALGDHAYKVVVNSTKSMTGHLLGAAGGIEAVFTTLAVHKQVSPPTINIFNQDPECDLDYCANAARDMKIDVALSNSFGFGGTNGSMVVRRVWPVPQGERAGHLVHALHARSTHCRGAAPHPGGFQHSGGGHSAHAGPRMASRRHCNPLPGGTL